VVPVVVTQQNVLPKRFLVPGTHPEGQQVGVGLAVAVGVAVGAEARVGDGAEHVGLLQLQVVLQVLEVRGQDAGLLALGGGGQTEKRLMYGLHCLYFPVL